MPIELHPIGQGREAGDVEEVLNSCQVVRFEIVEDIIGGINNFFFNFFE